MKNKSQKNIPIGWSQMLAGDIFSFVRSYSFSREKLTNGVSSNGNVGNIHYGDIHSTYNSLKINLKDTPIPIVNNKGFNPNKEDLIIDGDLVMSDASEDYEGVGVTVLIDGVKDRKVVGGLHTFVLRDKKRVTNKYYRQYIFRNPKVRNRLQKVANGVSVYGISKKEVLKLFLTIPPMKEQDEIVKILETWDEVINKLTKRIEIKKNIKKGLMQNLLTGKVRLTGFKDKWKLIKLGSLGKTYSGLTGKNKDDFGSGKPFITYMNIYSDSKININKCGLVKMNEEENQSEAQYGDIFFTTSSETPHEVGISSVLLDKNSTDLYLNSFCFGFRLNNFKTLLPEFARYYFRGQKFRREMTRIAQGASRYNLSKKYFLDTPINIPANIKEQEAIANVLSIADQELKLLSEKLSFLKDQKKYLLNNLVTGNIRIKA